MTGSMHLRRIDPDRNMARFYTMSVQPTLFGEWALLREWGRIGSVHVASPPSPGSCAGDDGSSQGEAHPRLCAMWRAMRTTLTQMT